MVDWCVDASFVSKGGSTRREKGKAVLAGATDRPWHMRAWSGINFSGWLRVLAENRFAVSPSRLAMAAIITHLSVLNSILRLSRNAVYGRRISGTALVDDPSSVLGHGEPARRCCTNCWCAIHYRCSPVRTPASVPKFISCRPSGFRSG